MAGKIAVLWACLLALGLSSAAQAAPQAQKFNIQGSGTVTRVIDGDTLVLKVRERAVFNRFISHAGTRQQQRHLDAGGQLIRVRIANINTAESVHPDKKKNTTFGQQAGEFLKSIAQDRSVGFWCWDFGYYGRLICSVSVGRKDIGLTMIQNGYSDYIVRYGEHPEPVLGAKYHQAAVQRWRK